MFDLLVIGEINPDLIIRDDDVVPGFGQAEKLVGEARLTIGSSSVIMACGAARLGLKVAFIGLVGNDEFGRFMLAAMQERGVDTTACVEANEMSTGISVILSQPGDRAILTYPGTIPLLSLDQIDMRMLAEARHLHVGSYFLLDKLRPDLPALFGAAKKLELTTSMDPNWDPRQDWDVTAVLPHLDVFLPNEEEVRRITGQDDFVAGLDLLAERVPRMGVKRGGQGSVARHGVENAYAPALPIEVVDTTGAGDSFDAGFIFAHLNNYSLQDSLNLASVCGSLSTRATGGTAAQPTLNEAQAFLRQYNELFS